VLIDFLCCDLIGDWRCERTTSLYDGIFCPEGQYKVPEERFSEQCDLAGQPCPEGYSCYCKPCIEAFEVSVYPSDRNANAGHSFSRDTGCGKMSLCGTVEQKEEIFFRAYDNRQRVDATVSALLHLGQESRYLEVHNEDDEEFLYGFGFSHDKSGVAILEVYVDGVQIPESPFRVEVVARDCEDDFPGQAMTAVRTKMNDSNNQMNRKVFSLTLFSELSWCVRVLI
jgi:hypothetical protein